MTTEPNLSDNRMTNRIRNARVISVVTLVVLILLLGLNVSSLLKDSSHWQDWALTVINLVTLAAWVVGTILAWRGRTELGMTALS